MVVHILFAIMLISTLSLNACQVLEKKASSHKKIKKVKPVSPLSQLVQEHAPVSSSSASEDNQTAPVKLPTPSAPAQEGVPSPSLVNVYPMIAVTVCAASALPSQRVSSPKEQKVSLQAIETKITDTETSDDEDETDTIELSPETKMHNKVARAIIAIEHSPYLITQKMCEHAPRTRESVMKGYLPAVQKEMIASQFLRYKKRYKTSEDEKVSTEVSTSEQDMINKLSAQAFFLQGSDLDHEANTRRIKRWPLPDYVINILELYDLKLKTKDKMLKENPLIRSAFRNPAVSSKSLTDCVEKEFNKKFDEKVPEQNRKEYKDEIAKLEKIAQQAQAKKQMQGKK